MLPYDRWRTSKQTEGIGEDDMAERTAPHRAKTLAHNLPTGEWQGFADNERELVAFGNANEIAVILGPDRNPIEHSCVAKLAREIATRFSY
jgi:hypothetical protein